MMKRVAIPIKNKLLSEYLGSCTFYEIFEIEGQSIKKTICKIPTGKSVLELPDWLKQQGVTDVIAYKIDRNLISLFASNKVNLFIGVDAKSPEKLFDDYLNGKLESDKNIIAQITNI
jgi:hypothetical protein